ncbi:glutamine synthetase [Rhodobium orientis]|nr:glutamine synthetase family protein [Rhodobium orientis]MBB4304954.1 glutamine synthetase [Rhodobium orientis]
MADIASDIAAGFLAEHGHMTPDDARRAADVIARIEADGIETVRFSFADQHGVLRGKTMVAGAVASAFRNGITAPSTLLLKDTSHRTVFPVWGTDAGFGAGALVGAGDILLVPDPATYRVLPFSPHSASILCDVVQKDGSAIPFSARTVLKTALDKLTERGLKLICGLEVEFHIFRIEETRLDHGDAGMPGLPPETSLLAHGYQLLTEGVYDMLEGLMDELRRGCETLGLPIRSMEAEFGPSQLEFTFDPDHPMAHADAMMLFRSMTKQYCRQRGLHGTFMCRPKVDNGAASGWHLHQSVEDLQTGDNLFMPESDGTISPTASAWIAGLLEHAAECCLLTTPTVNGYKRYQPYQLAPDRIQWGHDNKGAMIRALFSPHDRASRIENRVAEPAANPYYYFASQILAGLDGLARGLEAPAPVETPYDSGAPELPKSLISAVEAFEAGTLFTGTIGPEFVAYLSRIKRAEWDRYLTTVSEWEQREYFTLF